MNDTIRVSRTLLQDLQSGKECKYDGDSCIAHLYFDLGGGKCPQEKLTELLAAHPVPEDRSKWFATLVTVALVRERVADDADPDRGHSMTPEEWASEFVPGRCGHKHHPRCVGRRVDECAHVDACRVCGSGLGCCKHCRPFDVVESGF